MINVRLAAVCPPSSVSSRWPLCCFLFLSASPCCSLSHCLSHFQPFSSPSSSLFLFFLDHFQALAIHCVLCMCTRARHARKYSHAHTPLCLYLIIGSITGDIFPDNASEGGEPYRPNERRRSLYPSSHGSHSTGTPTD